uniref:Transmembrane protein 238 like n=1 Tax=Kryptolebias marmoratus TaxID=37003 RepID=A0A3Q2ZXE7_KRYMA
SAASAAVCPCFWSPSSSTSWVSWCSSWGSSGTCCTTVFLSIAIFLDIVGLLLFLIGVFTPNVLAYWDFFVFSGPLLIFLSLVLWIFWYTGNLTVSEDELDLICTYGYTPTDLESVLWLILARDWSRPQRSGAVLASDWRRRLSVTLRSPLAVFGWVSPLPFLSAVGRSRCPWPRMFPSGFPFSV